MRPGLPWRRFAAEAGIIVFSILMAFAVDRWWEGYQDAKRRALLLEDLEAELVENRDRLEEVLARQRLRVDRLDRLLNEVTPEAVGLDDDSIAALQDQVFFQVNFTPAFGILDLLIQSGELTLLPSRDLRARLAGLPSAYGGFLNNQERLQINLSPAIIFDTGSLLWDFSEFLPEERALLRADESARTAAVKFYGVMREATEVQVRVGESFMAELNGVLLLLAEPSG